MKSLCIAACLVLFPFGPLAADDARVDFERDVFPILRDHCQACHGPDVEEAQLRLDARGPALRGGVSGRLFRPGRADESLLVRRLRGLGDQPRMPLDEPPLDDRQIDVIRRWIDEGAAWPKDVGAQVEARPEHWAYVAPKRAPVPAVGDRAWPSSDVDYFVLARLEREGLRPSPPESRERLLRRVYLDLVGIPPTADQTRAFVNDRSPDAYERVVDALLASPRYGEHWARLWLDLARYADTNGYQADQYRSVWPYRDWVIDAMNSSMPYDQFTVEQLAGDLLPEAGLSQRIATGFHRLTTCNVEAGVDPEENRVEQIIDRVNTTGTVWLGTTIECAQCHNHKYDPITQADYYRLFAYFNNTPMEVEGDGVTYDFVGPKMELQLPENLAARRKQLNDQLKNATARFDQATKDAASSRPEWESRLLAGAERETQWHVLDIDSFVSEGGASHRVLDDGSVLVEGATPDKDTYVVEARTPIASVRAFRIETLTDPSLPGNGPGRHHPDRPNFILNELTIHQGGAASAGPRQIPLAAATADVSQKNWDVAGAIDGDPATGWGINPGFHQPHAATFVARQPVACDGNAAFVFRMVQSYGGGRTIGRLRLSATADEPAAAVEIPPSIDAILKTPAEKRNAKQKKELAEFHEKQLPELVELKALTARLRAELDSMAPPTTLVMIEMDEQRETQLLKRGDFRNGGERLEPGTPQFLPPPPPGAAPSRLGLAEWLVDPANPLVSRVAVNRWWAEFFGQGIVSSVEDLGTQCEPPTHPELLDLLAVEFVESGWSMKHVHRLIVTSATYRQSSRVTDELLAADPYNRLYARGPRHRLSAELIRDNALTAAGLLTSNIGGPPVFPPQPDGIWRHVGRNAPKYDTSLGADRYRRGVYVFWRRSAPYPSFVNFDAPDRAACVSRRPRTNTPLQALTLLNDPAYVEIAVALARRMSEHDAGTTAEKLAFGFQCCLIRTPGSTELDHLLSVFETQRKRFSQDRDAARALLEDHDVPPAADAAELAAWFCVANVLLNLDETVTK